MRPRTPPAPAAPPPPSARALGWAIVALALLGHAGLGGGFVGGYGALNYDDPQVMELTRSRTVAELLDPFDPTWYAYKPVYFLSLKVDAAFGDAMPQVAHGINWLLHALAAWLLYALLRAWLAPFAAFAAAALFAVHPVHVESVAWLSGRKDVLALVLVLAAHLAHRRGRARGRALSMGALLGFAAAGLTKGTVWPWAGLVALDEWHWRRGEGRGEPRTRVAARLGPWVGIALLGVGLDAWIALGAGPGGVDHGVGAGALFLAMAGVHARYLFHLLWPGGLALDYAVAPAGAAGDPQVWAGLLLGLLVLGTLLWGLRRGRTVAALAAGFWILGLAPVNNLFPRTATLMADRYLYVPAIGVYLLAGLWLARAGRARGWLLAGLVVALGAAANARTAVFQDSERAWSDTLAKVPHSALAWLKRGEARVEAGAYEAALADADRALSLGPRPELVVRARLLRAAGLLGLGRVEDLLDEANLALRAARALARHEMVREDPSTVAGKAENFRGLALEARGDLRAASLAYRAAVALDPTQFEFHYNYGTLLEREVEGRATAGRAARAREEAVRHLREAWRLNPRYLPAALQLATVLARAGDGPGARRVLEDAERRHGRSPDLIYALATVALEVERDGDRAQALLRELQERDPRHPKGSRLQADIHVMLGRARLSAGRERGEARLLDDAVHHFDLALQAQDSRYEAHVFAGDALAERGRLAAARARYRQALDLAPEQEWIAGLIARTAALETALLAREAEGPGARRAAAEVLARALGPPLRRLDLGFAPLEDELAWLRPAVALLDAPEPWVAEAAAGVLTATAWLVTGDEAGALEALRRVLATLPADAPGPAGTLLDAAVLLKAIVHARQGDREAARADYGVLEARRPGDPLPPLRRAQLDLGAALARRTIAEGHPDDPDALERARRGVERAADQAVALADAHPGVVTAGLLAVEADMHRARWIDALRRLNTLMERFPRTPSVHRGMMAVYMSQFLGSRDPGVLKDAGESLAHALDLDPRDLRTLLDAANYARRCNDLVSALRHARTARDLEPFPGGPAARLLADLHADQARKLLDGGQLEAARAAIDAARRADPARAAAWVLEGELVLKGTARDRYERALELARKAKELEPLDPRVNAFLARCHRERGVRALLEVGRHGDAAARAAWRNEAIRSFEAALTLDPLGEAAEELRARIRSLRSSDPDAVWERRQRASEAFVAGKVHWENGEWLDAFRRLREAVDLHPENPRAHYFLVEAVQRLLALLGGGAPDETAEARRERLALADRYLESGFYSLHQLDAMDHEGEFAERWFFRGYFNEWIYRAHGFAEARQAARMAYEHYLLKQRAMGAEDGPRATLARRRLGALRESGDR